MFNKSAIYSLKGIICLFICIILLAGCNPFAPDYDEEGLSDANFLGDQTTLDGFFTFFKNAYELRDTSLYGRLFTTDFVFEYYDPELGQLISWDRATEMNTTYNLFQAVEQINLDWNFYTRRAVSGDTLADVIRNFNLTIVQDQENVFVGAGRARMQLRRNIPETPWQAFNWFDDSDF